MESKEVMIIPSITPSGENSHRYLRLPYKMLTDALDNISDELSSFDAFIQMIANVRFNDHSDAYGNEIRKCLRGESNKSLQAWSMLFHWTKSKTRRFFIKLMNNGIIEMKTDSYTTHIRIIHYDYYVGRNYSSKEICYTADFEAFWKSWHDTTRLAETDKLATSKFWLKLSSVEREKALSKIDQYYFSLAKTTYCVKPLTYLKNKRFNDQFYSDKHQT